MWTTQVGAPLGSRTLFETWVFSDRSSKDRAAEETLRANLSRIRKITLRVAKRYGLIGADAEDFTQEVLLKLIEDDYRRIRGFRGRSSFKTYLTTVIVRLGKDYCNHLWGKWRPSAAAKRLGWEAELLERLIYREDFSFEEAAEKMRRDLQVPRSLAELAELAAKIPQRASRRFEGEEALIEAPAPSSAGDRVNRRVVDSEANRAAEKIESALQKALDDLDPEDRLILLFHYRGWTLAKIARHLKIDHKPLFRRRARLLAQLRAAMETHGVCPDDVQWILGWEKLDLKIETGDLPLQSAFPKS